MGKPTGFTKALPKNFKKVKPGYDQAFTLPKGTSAAPIKLPASKLRKTPIKPSKVTKSLIEGAVIGGAGVGGWELGKRSSSKKIESLKKSLNKRPITPPKKPITKKGWGKAYKRGR